MESTELFPDLKSAASAFTARQERIQQLHEEERTVTRRNSAEWLINGGLELGLLEAGGDLAKDAIRRHGGTITPKGVVVDRDGRAV